MTSDFALDVDKNSSKVSPNPKIAQNSVRAYCLALLSDAACFRMVLDSISRRDTITGESLIDLDSGQFVNRQ